MIDRSTGKMLSAGNFVAQNWNDGFDAATGRPKLRDGVFYEKPELVIPGGAGAHTWHSMSFDPQTGLVYIPAQSLPMQYLNDDKFAYRPHAWNTGVDYSTFLPPDEAGKRKAMGAMVKGELIAWDPVAQKEAWQIPHEHFWNGGVLTTAGNLVFEGGRQRSVSGLPRRRRQASVDLPGVIGNLGGAGHLRSLGPPIRGRAQAAGAA